MGKWKTRKRKMLKRERERKRGRKWVMIAKRHFTAKKRLQLSVNCVFPEWILCVGIEIEISQRKTETAASPLHISRMDSCSGSAQETKNIAKIRIQMLCFFRWSNLRKCFLIAFHS